jgi:hypothetical protein
MLPKSHLINKKRNMLNKTVTETCKAMLFVLYRLRVSDLWEREVLYEKNFF